MARGGPVPRPRHVPQRTCVACRQGRAKQELVRVVRASSGVVSVDPSGKASGRGAYLCKLPECWSRAIKGASLARALKVPSLSAEDAEKLSTYGDQLSVVSL